MAKILKYGKRTLFLFEKVKMSVFLGIITIFSILFFLKKAGLLMPIDYDKTYLSEDRLKELEAQDQEAEFKHQILSDIQKREYAEKQKIKEAENAKIWASMEQDYLDLSKKERTLQDVLLGIEDKLTGLTLDDYYKNPKNLEVKTDDLKENEDGSFELKVAYKIEKRKVGDVVEF